MPETAKQHQKHQQQQTAPVDVDRDALPPELTTIQPGGGQIMRLELAWGGLRRAWLRTFRKGYLERMARLRKGDRTPCPHEVLDPRDVKYYVNQPGAYYWERGDDPFTGRDRLPFARWGLAELCVITGGCLIVAIVLIALAWAAPWSAILREGLALLAVIALVGAGLTVYFFRDPARIIPAAPGLVVSPADGTIAEIVELDDHPFIGGPAVKVGIFLSIFNVHINRFPMTGRVVGFRYRPGKYLNALNPRSALENEQLHVMLETTDAADGPSRRMVVHLIAGLIARRIVCTLAPGDCLERGAQTGMIKLGSRTEIILPREEGLWINVAVGDKVRGGATVIGGYHVGISDVGDRESARL